MRDVSGGPTRGFGRQPRPRRRSAPISTSYCQRGRHACHRPGQLDPKQSRKQFRRARQPRHRLSERLYHGAVEQLSRHARPGDRRIAENRQACFMTIAMTAKNILSASITTLAKSRPTRAAWRSRRRGHEFRGAGTRATISRPSWSRTTPAAVRSAGLYPARHEQHAAQDR